MQIIAEAPRRPLEIDAVPEPGNSTIARLIVEIADGRDGPICWVNATMRRKAGDQ